MSALEKYRKMWHGENRAETREAASVVEYADAAIAELEAGRDALKCCGNCAGHYFSSEVDAGDSFCELALKAYVRARWQAFEGWEKLPGSRAMCEVDPFNSCHFTPSRWTKHDGGWHD